MAVKIRLLRMGKIRNPQYRIVVADSRTKRDGKAIEFIGIYHPKEDPSLIEVNSERVQHWLSVGAQPSEPVPATPRARPATGRSSRACRRPTAAEGGAAARRPQGALRGRGEGRGRSGAGTGGQAGEEGSGEGGQGSRAEGRGPAAEAAGRRGSGGRGAGGRGCRAEAPTAAAPADGDATDASADAQG